MPINPKVQEIAGRDQHSEGTLWDQEGHENAIRILVEEAKVNLCLRILHDFKTWQYDSSGRVACIDSTIKAFDYSEAQLQQRICQFEECLGELLRQAFAHVETLQLMDIPLLIEYCALVLTHCKYVTESMDLKHQEMVVLYYFASLMKHSEDLTGELLARSRDLRLVELAVNHFLQFHDRTSLEIKIALADGLAALAGNEDFETNWKGFFLDENGAESLEAKQNFLALEEHLSNPVLQEKPDKKREIRPLLDFYKKIKMSM